LLAKVKLTLGNRALAAAPKALFLHFRHIIIAASEAAKQSKRLQQIVSTAQWSHGDGLLRLDRYDGSVTAEASR
jgi:hypothetical protein